MKIKITKQLLIIFSIFSIFGTTLFINSCSIYSQVDNSQNDNSGNNQPSKPVNPPTEPEKPIEPPINPPIEKPDPTNPITYELWNEEENKNNLFSTLGNNNKLDIIQGKGANDVKTNDFSDGRHNTNPLGGNLINEQYKRLAQISYSVNFYNIANYLGTAWILDYEIPNGIIENVEGNTYDDMNYPTKWFFATNAHVMDDLKTPYSVYDETNSSKSPNYSTRSVVLTKIYDPQFSGTKNDIYYEESSKNSEYKKYYLYQDYSTIDSAAVKPIFLGFDFLKTSPSDFINNVPKPTYIPDDVIYTQTEEMADFAVFEVDFEKLNAGSLMDQTPQQLAKEITSNYANWSEKDKFKIPTSSLLYKTEDLKNNKYYALGYPEKNLVHTTGNGGSSDSVRLFINRPNDLNENEYLTSGSKMVKERHFNTFKNIEGIFDSIIGCPDFGYKFQPISSFVADFGIIPYIYQGLIYIDQNGDMDAGSSGSIFVDENNYIQGIHFASDFTSHVGFNFSLISEGYNYNGIYGAYNLVSYDLIRGGHPQQKSSYKDQLRKIYPNGINTYIFKDGIK